MNRTPAFACSKERSRFDIQGGGKAVGSATFLTFSLNLRTSLVVGRMKG
jgi:hypothetical protein